MNTSVRGSVGSWWGDLDRNRRLGLMAGAVVIVMAIAAFTWFSLHSDLVPLTGDLTKEDTASVVAQLEDIRARYQVDQANGAVLVPAADVESIRAQLAQKGWLLKAAPGFELFDNGDFGMTEFTEHINYQRALEGELARTIMALDAIRYARVHLVLPQSTLFKKSTEPPKASVLLVGRHGEKISEQQIAGIQRMVASSVPELKAENVSVHDRKGVELTSGTSGDLSPSTVDSGLHAQSDVEDYVALKAEEILGRIFPPGTATVSVSAVLSRSRTSSVRDEVLPSGQGSGAVSRIRSDSLPDGATAALPHPAHEAAPKGDISPPQFDVEYRIGHITEQSESAPGAIERLSIGIVIPDPSSQGLSVEGIRDLVAAGVGLDPQRGDRIAVYPVSSLSKAAVNAAQPAAGPADSSSERSFASKSNRSPPYWALFLGVALLLGAIALWMGRPRRGELNAAEREELLQQVRSWLQQ